MTLSGTDVPGGAINKALALRRFLHLQRTISLPSWKKTISQEEFFFTIEILILCLLSLLLTPWGKERWSRKTPPIPRLSYSPQGVEGGSL